MSVFKAPLKAYGDNREGATPDIGDVVLSQTTTLQAASVAAVNATIYLPQNAQILQILVDNTTLWTASGAVTLTAGTTSAGTQYLSAVDLKTVSGRSNYAFTNTQAANIANITTNTSVVFTATTASGSNAVGTTRVTVLYRAG